MKERRYSKEDFYIIRYQILTKISIQTSRIRSLKVPSCEWVKLRYFEIVKRLYTLLENKYLLVVNCSSIEIYHKSGSPIVTKPSNYFKLIHEFNDTDFNFIFVLPKRFGIFFGISSTLGLTNSNHHSFPITHFDTRSTYILNFFTSFSHLHVDELKYECSRYFHLPIFCISISLEDTEHDFFEHKLKENTVIHIDDIMNQKYKLYLVVSEEYWEPCFLNAFKYDNYLPICAHSSDTLVYLNAYLLFLVRKAKLKVSPDIVTGCLGLLRKISCFPPLIHSLQLLFSESIITLPHKIALVEGLITIISLLDFKFVHMELWDLPCLWHYLERNMNKSFIEYERSELQSSAKTPFCKEIGIHYRESPQHMNNYSVFRQRFFEETKYKLFPFENPIELFHKFLVNRFNTGLTRIPSNKKFIPCVFYGHSPNTSLQMIDCYSPYHGRLISFNPFEIETPERYVPSDINKYSKLLIILDISNDMNNTLDGLNYIPSHISPDNVFSQLDTALILIDIIIDFLVSSQLNYLLGITLVSNDHSFHNGYLVLQDLTLEYCYSVKDLRNWIINAQLSEFLLRPPSGGIVSALDYYIKKKYTNNTHIFLFTNQSYEKQYYGPNVHDINTNIQNLSYQVNVVLFGDSLRTRIELLCKKSHGKLINSKLFVCLSSKDSNDPMFYCSQFREYINFMRGLLTGNNTSTKFSSFEEVCRMYKSHLSRSDQFIGKFDKQDKSLDCVTLEILHQLSIYTKEPNPFVTMYSVNEDITRWLLFLKCPPNTSFFGTDHILSLAFSRKDLHKPPSIEFLTPILHPNIYPNGKICHPILFEDYVPRVTTLKTVIDSILSLLCKPIRTHVINSSIGEYFLTGSSIYDLQISTVKEFICMKSMSRREQEKYLKINLTTSPVSPPNYLICPLTKELYNFPVISPDGNTFERSAIIECLKESQIDPISKNPLTEENLFPNYAIADSVFKYKMNFK